MSGSQQEQARSCCRTPENFQLRTLGKGGWLKVSIRSDLSPPQYLETGDYPFPLFSLRHRHTLKRQNRSRKFWKNGTREAMDLAHQAYCRVDKMRTDHGDQSVHILNHELPSSLHTILPSSCRILPPGLYPQAGSCRIPHS